MRFRAWFALVLVATMIVRVAPCAATAAAAKSDHECCDAGMCPGKVSSGMHHDMPMASPCCAVTDQRQRQQHQQIPVSPVTVAPDDEPGAVVQPPAARPIHRSDHVPLAARGSPLHVRFSVFLI